jgi:glucose/arabinose dehydrogenase
MRRAVAVVTAGLALLATGCSSGSASSSSGASSASAGASVSSEAAGPASPTAPAGPRVRLQQVAAGFTTPVGLVSPPAQPDRRLVIDQVGVVSELDARGGKFPAPFLDLRSRVVELYAGRDDERGLLGLAFHPGWQQNRRVFVFYTARPPAGSSIDHVNVLSEFAVRRDGAAVEPSSERVLLRSPQRQSSHAAGQLLFDASGRLLVFTGDALEGSAYAQNPRSLYGKVLRLDVDAAQRQVPQLLASGLRHPWRVSYDHPSERVLIAEPNFTSRHQEVNVLAAGANYGWQLDVAKQCYPEGARTADPTCLRDGSGRPLTPPAAEYGPDDGLIVSGAIVYRGSAVPALRGKLVLSEWGVGSTGRPIEGRLLSADVTAAPPWRVGPVTIDGGRPEAALLFWSLARDGRGELYVLAMRDRGNTPGGGMVLQVAGR